MIRRFFWTFTITYDRYKNMSEEKPTWCYKSVTVLNLLEIQNELKQILYKIMPEFDNYNSTIIKYIPLERKDIEPYCPLYTEYIKSLGLIDRWNFSLLSIIANSSKEYSENNIHVDTENWQYRCYGLNLPIVNCEGTYTVWYEGSLEDNNATADNQRLKSARFLRTDLPYHEIARIESSNPAWVNVSIPHVAMSTHGKPRAAFSARFNPEVHDILA